MADTLQVVNWSLERKCVFRRGDGWFLPNRAHLQLSDLRTVAKAATDNRIVGGICVTSWTGNYDNSGNYHKLPHDGFRIEERLGKFGGLSAVVKACGQCEANVENKLDTKVAGCFGSLHIWPDSPELDEQLWQIIEEHDIEHRLHAAFPVTTPLWYGFWIESPLRRLQAEFLYELLDAACDYDNPTDNDIVHFLNALTAAIEWELPVHVALAPLGHADLGWYTVFPHCPRCKANAPVGRWKQSYPTEPLQCKVCGHTFIPDQHHSCERDGFDWNATTLRKQLGERGHWEFTRRFLLHRGVTAAQVEEILDNQNDGPLLRCIADVRKRRAATMRTLRKKRLTILQRFGQLMDFATRRKLRRKRTPFQYDVEPPRTIAIALTDDIDLEFVLVPSGEFLMGSSDPDGHPNDSPAHIVRFENPFYIGRFPVTQAQWEAVMGSNPSRYKGDPDLPVDRVSWFDCQEFCERLCFRHRRVIRLPSEAEWEYACRAGTTSKFAFGDSLAVDQANYTPAAEYLVVPPESESDADHDLENLDETNLEGRSDRKRRPTPVGSYPPNAWGLYDMHGNVLEWCEDVWHETYDGAPADGSAWLLDEDKQRCRVMRGGWCSATENACTSASRIPTGPDAGSREKKEDCEDEEGFLDSIFEMFYMPYGFRVVCEN